MTFSRIFALAAIAAPFVYLASIYGGLPTEIPIHFDWRGSPDGWGSKTLLWILPLLGAMLILIINQAGKRLAEGEAGSNKFRKIGWLTTAFIAAILCYIIYGAQAGGYNGLGGLSVLLGLLFATLGNYLPVIRQNPWFGVRVPPTLKSDRNWRATHRFAGPIFLGCGLLMVANGLLLPNVIVPFVLLVAVAVMTVVPIVYAYRFPEDPEGDFV